jgi:hypothetical protein
MKRIIGIIALCLFSISYSQEETYNKIDYERLREVISDSTNPLYYPKLMERYTQNDTTLSLDEYRCLYYGYTFQNRYNPYWYSKQSERLNSVYAKESIRSNDCDTIIKYATLSIEDNPFDMRQIKMLGYAYHLKGNDSMSVKWYIKKIGITDAILSTGDGRKCESGFSVILTSHEYEILQLFKLEFKKQSLSKDCHCDCMTVENSLHEIDYIYFDIWRMMQAEMKQFKK